jgi:predicted CXXCH cytochrome family protein
VSARFLLAGALLLLASTALRAQVTGDVIGVHDLTTGSKSPITGARPGSCTYCHAPHSGFAPAPLWNQTFSKQTYSTYTSTTYHQAGNTIPPIGADSSLCLSCHDGTVAPGQTIVYGAVTMSGSMSAVDVFGTNLQNSHPFSLVLPIKDTVEIAASLVSQGKTADLTGAVHLVQGNIECTSCHDPHVQAKDTISQNFLVRDSSSGQMCLACHDPTRVLTGQINHLAGWATGIHGTAANKTTLQSGVGSYGNVGQNACLSCHTPHNGQGPARLLRAPNEQDCLACHSGGSNISPGIPNVFAEFAKVGHPFPAGVNTHDAAESVVLNNNRHATCVDCHNGHPANQVTSFTPPPLLRPSQNGIAGVSAADGATTVYPAVNEYDNCLRCHGTSAGKVVNPIYGYLPARLVSSGDFLNVIPQFAISSTSSHPVMHVSNSALSQPSLLANMLDLDGLTQGRSTGVQIFCSDCHNSDDNREFGGTGPNGPHGTKWTHILERQYVASETTAPGQLITNLKPNPDLTVSGPYALCGKCHNLANVISNASFSEHARHINDGFSCSVCHTAHGMGGTSSTVSGERLVNFDVNVVATNDGPISYSRATNSCGLICHGHAHELSGPTVTRKHGTPLPRPLTQTWPQPWPPQSPRRE